jgi:hypothetical protein
VTRFYYSHIKPVQVKEMSCRKKSEYTSREFLSFALVTRMLQKPATFQNKFKILVTPVCSYPSSLCVCDDMSSNVTLQLKLINPTDLSI